MAEDLTPQKGEMIVYETADGGAGLEVRLRDETIWLSLNQPRSDPRNLRRRCTRGH